MMMTDQATLALLGQRIAQHRLQQNRTQAALALEAGVSKRTIERLENGESVQLTNLVRTLRVLDLLTRLDDLVPEMTPGPLAQLRSNQQRRKRASGGSGSKEDRGEGKWTWGDEEGSGP